ncbi:hypothetical protein GCM10022243_01150 [Saccharothrix violaceirubra]|uniref:Immunity protein Imm1 n=1 Tax=Saccharothrix violaceirubra TaxID=413306 RepID=A0A7W7WVJ2_9PSEU|nr:Imm1 family immunity protein [Saccharothrix violaceirubra]MBB4965389.1 hypothetical protein [Saccharothrix violaceirubra]
MTHLEAVYHNDRPVSVLRDREDVARFVQELLAADWEHSAATVHAVDPDHRKEFPDHELTIGVDPDTGMGGLRYTNDEGTWYSRGDRTNRGGVVYVYFDTGHDFPADSEVRLHLIHDALDELLGTGGQRPHCVAWQEATDQLD